jgi:hypothetical protein
MPIRTGGGGSGGGSLDDLSDVTITTPTANQALLYNGIEWVNAAQGTSFSFSVASFSQSGGGSTTQEMGPVSTEWKAIGAVSFSASYNNGPATGAYVSHTGWSGDLTMTGTGYVGPTATTEAINYPSAVAGTRAFVLHASKGAATATSTITFSFVNRRFWGITTKTSGYTESDIEGLASNELSNSKAQTKTITAGSGDYLCFSWPARLGTGTFYVGTFEGGFESPETVSVTNASGFAEDYYIYRSTQDNLGSTTVTVV